MSQTAPPAEVGLSVAAVARRIGIAPATLRTWDRRYGLGPTLHKAGSHRRYSAIDVARIDLMRKLMLNGVLPSEAARSAMNQEVSPADLVQGGPDLKPKSDVKQVTANNFAANDATPDNVIAIDGPKAIIRSLTRAASNLDATGCDQVISNSVKAHGVVWTWEQVLLPVLISVGEKWAETGEGVEQEHLLSESIIGQFRSLTLQVTQPENARPVLLACAPHELHTIPIFAIAAALAEQNIASRILGARMPAQALANAVKKLGPSAVVVWSQTLGTADTSIWDLVEPMRPGHLRICAGPGWQEALPADVTKPNDFTSTLVALAAASGR